MAMKSHLEKKMLQNQRKAIYLSALILWIPLTGFLVYSTQRPLISTMFYHANVQFRAGNEESYDDIYRNSLEHIIDMYAAHPQWKWTLECQGLLLEMAFYEYHDIFIKIQIQNQRGQLELICPQYSHALALAYPYKDFAESIAYNLDLMENVYNLTISNVMLLQEGQWLPAFPLIKHLGIDTMLVSRDQLSYQNYYPTNPILEYSYEDISAYVIPMNMLPTFEGGVYHHNVIFSDSERSNTGGLENPTPGIEFEFNPEKQANLLAKHEELERKGNIWMSMSDWRDHCIARGDVGRMDQFMPESHWIPENNQNIRWMSWGIGETQDSSMLARNYYTRQRIQMGQVMLERASPYLTPLQSSQFETQLISALKHLWMAEVTDTTGLAPRNYEFVYGINHTWEAQTIVNDVITDLRGIVPEWAGRCQIDTYQRQVLTDPSEFTNVSTLISPMTIQNLEQKYGFGFSVDYLHQDLHPYNITLTNHSLAVLLADSVQTFNFEKIYVDFTGPYGFLVNNTRSTLPLLSAANFTNCNLERSAQYIHFQDTWKQIHYTPSLADNYTIGLTRSDYTSKAMEGDDFYTVPLPICNGLLYNDEQGYAIITNNTVGHIAVTWEEGQVFYYEKETIYNAHYEFLLFRGSLEQAHLLATLVNTYPILEV